MKHAVIYIPGLGDDKSYGQNIALNIWRVFGLSTHYLPLEWAKKEGLMTKLDKIDQLVTKISNENTKVSLVGVSAGASAVLNYYSRSPDIHKIILICGKVNFPENIHPARFSANPDFKESMNQASTSLETIDKDGLTKNILSIYSPNDTTVPPKDSRIVGAKMKKIPAWSHASVIINTLLFHGRYISRFIKTD